MVLQIDRRNAIPGRLTDDDKYILLPAGFNAFYTQFIRNIHLFVMMTMMLKHLV